MSKTEARETMARLQRERGNAYSSGDTAKCRELDRRIYALALAMPR